jgi:cytochrome P450
MYAMVMALTDRRFDSANLTFGVGRHFCTGTYLVRAEIQIAIATLLKRFTKLELLEQLQWKPNLRKHGLKSLVIKDTRLQ